MSWPAPYKFELKKETLSNSNCRVLKMCAQVSLAARAWVNYFLTSHEWAATTAAKTIQESVLLLNSCLNSYLTEGTRHHDWIFFHFLMNHDWCCDLRNLKSCHWHCHFYFRRLHELIILVHFGMNEMNTLKIALRIFRCASFQLKTSTKFFFWLSDFLWHLIWL